MALQPSFPVFSSGHVIHGLGNGKRLLGIPTANLPINATEPIASLEDGVYYGFCRHRSMVLQAVVSMGSNVHFGTVNRTLEVHILHQYEEDFYGEEIHVTIVGLLRSMRRFSSNDELSAAIREDIEQARQLLKQHEDIRSHSYLTEQTRI